MFTKSFHQILFYKKNEKNNPFTPQPAGPPRPLLAGVYTGPGSSRATTTSWVVGAMCILLEETRGR